MIFRISLLGSDKDFESCEDLQKRVWGFQDEHLISGRALRVASEHGAIILGCRSGDGPLVGFAFSFPAPCNGRLIHHSHMVAVLPEYRDQGIGARLKLEQRRILLSKGFDRLTWTFDPLEARNAYLNLNRLGVRIQDYLVNYYGEETGSSLHSGIGTDRFLVEWDLTSARPVKTQASEKAVAVITTSITDSGFPEPIEVDLALGEDVLEIEVPSDIQSLKTLDPRIAKVWRTFTRSAFQTLLGRGYSIVALRVEMKCDNHRRVFYVLNRSDSTEPLRDSLYA